jgi:hypothetical protein
MKRLLFMLLALALSGCSTRLKALDDLAYVGMQYKKQPPPFREPIRIDFSTAHDFQDEIIKDGHLSHMNAAFCRQTKHGFTYFYSGDVWRWGGEKFIALSDKIQETPNARHIYSIFFFDSLQGRTVRDGTIGGYFPQDYDLRKNPEDICVRFEMTHGMGFRKPSYSKIVRIPKEEFIKLFASHPQ